MRLSSIAIRNFKCIDEIQILIPKTDATRIGSADFVSIIGRNNAGKSSILEAICLALPGVVPIKPSIEHFFCHDVNRGPIEVEFEFDEINEVDKTKPGVRTHVFSDKYRIMKRWTQPNSSPIILAYEPETTLKGFNKRVKKRQDIISISETWEEAVLKYEEKNDPLPDKLKVSDMKAFQQFALEKGGDLVEQGQAKWLINPGGIQANVDSILPIPIYVPAIRETKAEADPGTTNSAANQIVDAMFEKELSEHNAIVNFKEAGEAVKALFAGDEGDQVIKRLETNISDKISRVIDLKAKLDFTPPDVTSDLAKRTDLYLVDNELPTTPEHQGHGAQRSLLLSLLEILAENYREPAEDGFIRSLLVLIEEPEIYLHPHMCRKMRDVLTELSRSGHAQVICTTHSPVFINLADRHDGIVRAEKIGKHTALTQRATDLFWGSGIEEQRKRLRMLLDFDPAVNEVFFAERVVLVEGDTEVASVGAVANKLMECNRLTKEKYMQRRADISIINCRGKWTIVAFQRVLDAFGIPYVVVHDKDNDEDSGASAAILELLGGEEDHRLVHCPNFEKDIFNEEWTGDKPWKAVSRISAMEEPSTKLVRFLEFVLGTGISQLLAVSTP